jgi:hypothetical protein
MKETIVYFEKPGRVNTLQVLSLVKERAQARGIQKVVLASVRGEAARAAVQAFEGSGLKLVVIPWQFGFGLKGNRGDRQPFPRELVTDLEGKGHKVHFGTMLFHTENLYGTKTPEAMGNLLRIFGQGTKVCVEIIMMATDGGCIEAGEKVIAVASTGSGGGGADTALVATAAPSTDVTRLCVHEIVCKPLLLPEQADAADPQ